MKRIAVVTNTRGTQLEPFLRGNLEEVLDGRAEISFCAIDALDSGALAAADLVLVMLRSKILELRNLVPEVRRILVLQRTLRKSDLYRIFAIPKGTRVLVVNDAPETTVQTVALLQQLEINHLQFVPYTEGLDCRELRIAITPGERARVPQHIGTVIDVGNRCIDISTFIEIINRLELASPEVDRRLLRYSETIVTLDRGIDHQYKELVIRNTELDTVINLAHEGILLLAPDGRVVLHNRALAAMLDLPGELNGGLASAFPPELRQVLERKQGKEWIVDYQGRSLVITRQEIELFGEPAGQYFNFQEVTYIRQLEQNLSRKLREKGQTARYRFTDILTRSPKMGQCIDLARRIAGSDFTVLIIGESGTGKELLAQSIHHESPRSHQPFVAVNCAAVPENLLESELFGYEGGSFTGALKEGKAGLFEQAHHGTVFLDEIGDMPLTLQAKLLRVLQERQITRLGSQKVINVNIRVIAATNRDLRERIRTGRFREDLYYRLNALPLLVPPLRQRPEDIFPLLEHFLAAQHRPGLTYSAEARLILQGYPWPGNIRELNNVANYIAFMSERTVLREALPHYLFQETGSFERETGILAAKGGLARARAILEVLAQPGRSAGRKQLEAALAAKGAPLREGEIRSALSQLKELALVSSGIGRKGTELTARGRQFLNGPETGS